MDSFIDLLEVLGAFVAGGGAGWLIRRLRSTPEPVQVPSEALLSPGPGGNKCYVRFTFADGRVDVKKMRSVDIDPVMIRRGRLFDAAEWTEDGHVFRERVSG